MDEDINETKCEIKIEDDIDIEEPLVDILDCNLDPNGIVGIDPFQDMEDNLPIAEVKTAQASTDKLKGQPIPIVYTTRLDDMHLWWTGVEKMAIEDITESIVSESKPKFTGNLENFKSADNYRRTYSRLKENIEEINRRANFNKTNKQTFHKPVSGWDRRKRGSLESKSSNKSNRIYNVNKREKNDISVTSLVSVEYPNKMKSSSNDVLKFLFSNYNKKRQFNIATTDSLSNVTKSIIIFNDIQPDMCDIYVVKTNNIPTDYYRLTTEDTKKILMDLNSSDTTCLFSKFCCWYKREQNINELAVANNNYRFTYMRTSHKCKFGFCMCCCRKKYAPVKTSSYSNSLRETKTSKFGYTYTHNSKWNKVLLHRITSQDDWIYKALGYTPKLPPKRIKKIGRNIFKDSVVLVQNPSTVAYYSGGQSKDRLKTCIRLLGSLNTNIFNIKHIMEPWLYQSKVTTCCWLNYRAFLVSLSKTAPPDVIKFMKKSHPCSSLKCFCCCKSIGTPQEIRASDINHEPLPIRLQHTTKLNKNTEIIPRWRSKLKDDTAECDSDNSTPIIRSKSQLPKIKVVSPTTANQQCLDRILNKVLTELAGLRFTINPDGNVVAQVEGNPRNISTMNLKILKVLLESVQNRVNSCKFTPSAPITIKHVFSKDMSTQSNVNSKNKYGNKARKDTGLKSQTNFDADHLLPSRSMTFVHKNVEALKSTIGPPTVNIEVPKANIETPIANIEKKNESIQKFTIQQVTAPRIVPNVQVISIPQLMSSVPRMSSPQTASFIQIPQAPNIPRFQTPPYIPIAYGKTPELAVPMDQSPDKNFNRNKYEHCTQVLYDKRVQYYKSLSTLLTSGNENIASSLKLIDYDNDNRANIASAIINWKKNVSSDLKANITSYDAISGDDSPGRKQMDEVPLAKKKRLKDADVPVLSNAGPKTHEIVNPGSVALLTDSSGRTLIPVTLILPEGQSINPSLLGGSVGQINLPIMNATQTQSITGLASAQNGHASESSLEKNIMLSNLLSNSHIRTSSFIGCPPLTPTKNIQKKK